MRIVKLILKDLKSVFTDPKIVVVLVIMPVVLTSILGIALSGVFSDDYTIPSFQIAIVKEYDNEQLESNFEDTISRSLFGANISKEDLKDMSKGLTEIDMESIFFDEFFGSDEVKEIVEYDVVDFNTAMKGLEKDSYSAMVVLPDNFLLDSYINMLTPFRNEIKIEVYKNPNHRITGGITENLIRAYSDTFSSMVISKNVLIQQFAKYDRLDQGMEQMDTFIDAFSVTENNMDIEVVPIEGKKTISSISYYAMGMMTLFLLFSAAQGSTLLLSEKKGYTLQRMMVAGYKHYQIVMGKYVVVFAIAILQMMIMIFYSRIAFNVVWGRPASVAVVVILSAFAIAGLGTMFSVITLKMGNYSLAIAMETVVFHIFGLIGGAYIPIQVLPEMLQRFSIVPINGVALNTFMQIMSGGSLADVRNGLLIIAANGMVFTAVAIIITKMERGKGNANRFKVKPKEV